MTSELAGSAGAGSYRRDLPPLTYALPQNKPAADHRRTEGSGLARLCGLVMYALSIWMAVSNGTFRDLEAGTMTPLIKLVTGGTQVTSSDMIWFGLGTPRAFGLHITNGCTSAVLLIPLLVMMGTIAIFTRLRLSRQLLAVISGAAVILVVNLMRMVGIAWATWEWGANPGYEYSHLFAGSAFALVGFVGAIILAAWLLVSGDRPKFEEAIRISRAWWAARAPAGHRMNRTERGVRGGRPPAAHVYKRRRR